MTRLRMMGEESSLLLLSSQYPMIDSRDKPDDRTATIGLVSISSDKQRRLWRPLSRNPALNAAVKMGCA